ILQHVDSVILSAVNRMKRSRNESRRSWLFRVARAKDLDENASPMQICRPDEAGFNRAKSKDEEM
ncbi:hypothetical protein GBF38_005868, partial [Nibea albiflora]